MRAVDSLDYAFAGILAIVAVGVLGASAAVLRYYAGPLRRVPRRHGLLLRHIVIISAAEVLLWATLLLAQLELLGLPPHTPRPLRLALYTVAGIGKVAAILIIASVGRRRVRSLPTEVQTETVVRHHDGTVIDQGG